VWPSLSSLWINADVQQKYHDAESGTGSNILRMRCRVKELTDPALTRRQVHSLLAKKYCIEWYGKKCFSLLHWLADKQSTPCSTCFDLELW
jgi:hypothetical protein